MRSTNWKDNSVCTEKGCSEVSINRKQQKQTQSNDNKKIKEKIEEDNLKYFPILIQTVTQITSDKRSRAKHIKNGNLLKQ